METSDLTEEYLDKLEAMAKAEQKRAARARGEDVSMTRDELEKALAFFAHETDTALALIAEVRRLRGALDESRRLTAAAPDLLAALERTVGELDVAAGYVRSAGASEHAKACSMAIRKAKAAIARAKGEA